MRNPDADHFKSTLEIVADGETYNFGTADHGMTYNTPKYLSTQHLYYEGERDELLKIANSKEAELRIADLVLKLNDEHKQLFKNILGLIPRHLQ